jgi:hypothetical protein
MSTEGELSTWEKQVKEMQAIKAANTLLKSKPILTGTIFSWNGTTWEEITVEQLEMFKKGKP